MALQLLVYGDIGFDVRAADVAKAIAESKGLIHVRVNSGGGSAFDGLAIYQLLRTSGRRVEVDIDGIAASAASVIAMAGDVVRIARGGFKMIHNSASGGFGGADDLREQADVLSKIDVAMAQIYAKKTGRSEQEIRQLMADETWFNADEALAAGLVDQIVEGQKAAAMVGKAAQSWTKAPAEVKASLQQRIEPAIVGENHTMDPKALQDLIQSAVAAALAPVAARIDALEKPSSSPAPAPDDAPAIEVVEAKSEAELVQAKALFDTAVTAAFKRYVAEGKLAPGSEAQFRRSCKSVEDFQASCAEYDLAKPIVATAPVSITSPESKGSTKVLSAAASEFCRKNGFDTSKWTQKVQLSEGK